MCCEGHFALIMGTVQKIEQKSVSISYVKM